MTLRLLRYLLARLSRVREHIRPAPARTACARVVVALLASMLTWQGATDSLLAQAKRMIIDGSIRSGDFTIPPNAKIRILHEDGSVARTVMLYDQRNLRFGVRLSPQDQFVEDERILFRVVTTPQDSFLARFSGPPLKYKESTGSERSSTSSIVLFKNSLPTIYRRLPDTTIKEDQQLRFRIVAIDRDADTVKFRLKNPPRGATIDPLTGLFLWRPAYDQAGRYNLRILVSDGYDTDSSRTAAIIVQNVNRAPHFVREMADTTIREADTLRSFILAVDPDDDRMTYGSPGVPNGMKVDSASGAVEWIPTYDQSGSYTVRFVVSDGQAYDTSRSTNITVRNVNRPPVFITSLRDTVVRENEELLYSFVASDPDGDSVVYALVHGPEGMVVSSAGLLTWRPSFTQSGIYTYEVAASDRDTLTKLTERIRVLNTDRPPAPSYLEKPVNGDTVRLALMKPVTFSWSRSFDPDSDDTIRYRVHIWGTQFDTLVGMLTDTVVALNIKPHLMPLSRYHWTVMTNDGYMSVAAADTFVFRTSAGIVGSTEFLSEIPKSYYLEQSLPDPFNPVTTLRYALPERSYVKLAIYSMLGEPVLVLVSGDKEAGVHEVTFDASEFTSGAYMFRLDAHPLAGNQFKDFVNTKKMFIVR